MKTHIVVTAATKNGIDQKAILAAFARTFGETEIEIHTDVGGMNVYGTSTQGFLTTEALNMLFNLRTRNLISYISINIY